MQAETARKKRNLKRRAARLRARLVARGRKFLVMSLDQAMALLDAEVR